MHPNLQQQPQPQPAAGMEAKLYRAAKSGSVKAMSGISNWSEQLTPTQNNILHIHVGKSSLFKMVGYDKKRDAMIDTEFIKHVLEDEQGYWLLWKQNSNGDTPLHLASKFGHSDAVKAFLEQAKEVYQPADEVSRMLSTTNKSRDTALHQAARAGHAKVVKLLVEADANCSNHNEQNEEGETPLYLAAERGSTPCVLAILRICSDINLSYKGPCGRTALHAAVQWGGPVMVQKMLNSEGGSQLLRIQNDEGLTPLHCAAAEKQKLNLLNILVENESESSLAVYMQDNMGRTPLHIAMLQQNWKALDKLMESYPDCIEIVDNKGQNVLHYAAERTYQGAMHWAMTRAIHLDKYINDKDKDGNTPLHIFAASIRRNPDVPFSLSRLKGLINNYPSLDSKAFDKHNHTFGDILHSLDISLDWVVERPIVRKFPRGRRINTYAENRSVDVEKGMSESWGEWDVEAIKKAAESRLIVAALIATVSFTAAFTVPGGLVEDQNAGKNVGTAVLKSKASFKVFMISDAIAFMTSTLAILHYFLLVSSSSKTRIRFRATNGLILNTISLGALMIAFVAAVWAVSPHRLGFVIIALSVLSSSSIST